MATSNTRLAFVVPTLGETAAQDEDVLQLLLYAAARLEHERSAHPEHRVEATIVTVEPDTHGWPRVSAVFSEDALQRVSIEQLAEPVTPCLAIPCHKSAYNVFEWLKTHEFDEVHGLDRHGVTFYPSQAKHLGLHGLHATFAVHVVGGTLFRKESADELLDSVDALAEDMLERGSIQRADVICVHDRKAWRWYEHNVEGLSRLGVHDLAWPVTNSGPRPLSSKSPQAIIYYGTLGVDGGLPIFCDAIDCVLPSIQEPLELIFVGTPGGIGGIDAVSYIRLRSSKWPVTTTIRRDLSISDELSFLHERGGVVVCNTVRREGLRPRLLAGAGLCTLSIDQGPEIGVPSHDQISAPIPGQIAKALIGALGAPRPEPAPQYTGLSRLWSSTRPLASSPIQPSVSPPLAHPGDDQPKVSVCVTHYSRPDKLRTALDSLKRQTYRNFEVIVVDDGSPGEETQKELEAIGKEIAGLGWRVVAQENRYLGAARNFAATYATGSYLLFMDDDNVAKPHELSTLVAVAQRTKADIVTAFCDVFETEQDLDEKIPPRMRFTPYGSDPALGIFTNCYGDANALYTRKIFDHLGGFTEDYGITHEDWELFCLASLEGANLVCVPEPLFWYRVDRNAMFRGARTQLHKASNLRRHIRPYLKKLPPYQAKLVQLAQGLATDLPLETVGKASRSALSVTLREPAVRLPYARVAVIMRTKDRPLLLRRAIRSVLEQTFKDWVLVIVNDGGQPDNIQLAMGEMADELEGRVLVLNHPVSLGMQAASNAGINNCDSDFIIIHDDDDSWDRTFLARTVSYLDERGWDSNLGGVITWATVIVEELTDDGEIKECSRFVFNDRLRSVSLADLAVENRFPPISFLVRRVALDAVGPFREAHGPLGDWEFHLRVLQQFEIGVIHEPLANYHHRTRTMEGDYGNSVHAQEAIHQSKRVELVNAAIRQELVHASGVSPGQLLFMGQLHKTALDEQRAEFRRLHDYLWNIENQVKAIASHNERPRRRGLFGKPCNMVVNGDFRVWPGLGRVYEDPAGTYAFRHVCPGLVLNYNGLRASYRVERLTWREDGDQLPFGKTYLHIEHDGCPRNDSWFMLEFSLPSVQAVAGRSLCISGSWRIEGSSGVIAVGGRHSLGGGRELRWPDQPVSASETFRKWTVALHSPNVLANELKTGQESRILLKIPCDQAFEFDMTDLQVELGKTPTTFEYYNGDESLRGRLSRLWKNATAAARSFTNSGINLP